MLRIYTFSQQKFLNVFFVVGTFCEVGKDGACAGE